MVDDGLGAEALDEVVDGVMTRRSGQWQCMANLTRLRPTPIAYCLDTSTICPGCSGDGIAFRPRLDQEDQLLPGLQRVDHRRREFRIGRDVADARRQARPAAVAMDGEQRCRP